MLLDDVYGQVQVILSTCWAMSLHNTWVIHFVPGQDIEPQTLGALNAAACL